MSGSMSRCGDLTDAVTSRMCPDNQWRCREHMHMHMHTYMSCGGVRRRMRRMISPSLPPSPPLLASHKSRAVALRSCESL